MKWQNLALGWAALLAAAGMAWAWRQWLRRPGIFFSQSRRLGGLSRGIGARLAWLPLVLRCLALGSLALALLRPQALQSEDEVKLKGVNLMLVADLSGSMIAEDLTPNRITAAKKVLAEFVGKIKQDQVGLVVFGAKSFTQAPLTLDYDIVTNAIQEIDLNTVDADGTAIGDGLLTAINRLSQCDGQTNIIILATDGTNNRGEDPLQAAEIAAAKKIRIFAVGIGAKGGAPIYTTDAFGTKRNYVVDGKPMRWEEPNDKVLSTLAQKTGGEYYRATDTKTLEAIYNQIDQMIKQEKKRRDPHYKDFFPQLLLIAGLALGMEFFLSFTRLRFWT